MSTDEIGYATLNPLYMKYVPGPSGHFSGQQGYGYRSIEEFVDEVVNINSGHYSPSDISNNSTLATIDSTARVTAVLEAGRRSLDSHGKAVRIVYSSDECSVSESDDNIPIWCHPQPITVELER
jgi:D-galacturonate reductase